MNSLDHHILTLVTFAPLVGALLLVVLPRRDRDIRIFSLVISLLTFVLSLHLPVYFKRPLDLHQMTFAMGESIASTWRGRQPRRSLR